MLGAGWAWLPGLQDKQGRTQAGQEGGRRQEGEQVSQEHADTKDLLSAPLWPREQPPASQPKTSGQVSQGALGVRHGQMLTSRLPLPLGACFFLLGAR